MKKQLYSRYVLLLMIIAFSLAGCRGNSREQTEMEKDTRIEQAEKDGQPVLIVSNAEGKPGDTVKIAANIVNNPGILGMTLTLSYDENVLKLLKADMGEAFKDILDMSHSKELESGCVFLWDGETISDEQIVDGELLVMEFKILKEAANGVSTVQLICNEDSTINNNLEVLDVSVEKGVVTIQ